MLRWSIQIHKWLALVVGLQVLGWVLGGVVMSAIPIEIVRSEHRLMETAKPPLPAQGLLDHAAAARAAGVPATEAALKQTPRGTFWVLKSGDGETRTVDAVTGRPMPRLTEAEAVRIARSLYRGPGRAVGARWYDEAPQETGKEGPLWRVDFDDAEGTAFYLSPETGELVSRRSKVWRFYDFFWRIHILDFKEGEDFNHPLLIGAAVLTLPMTIAGLVLLWIRLRRDWIGARARRSAQAR